MKITMCSSLILAGISAAAGWVFGPCSIAGLACTGACLGSAVGCAAGVVYATVFRKHAVGLICFAGNAALFFILGKELLMF